MSETAPRRHLTEKYCQGNGVDVGSGGDPVVPWAVQCELPQDKFDAYGHAFPYDGPIQFRMTGVDLPFKDSVLDFVYSSHLLEDFEDWTPVLKEWIRVLKPGGYLVILLPCKKRFNEAVARHEAVHGIGTSGNANHKHEAYVGELTELSWDFGLEPIEDRYTDLDPYDYNILYVGKKVH